MGMALAGAAATPGGAAQSATESADAALARLLQRAAEEELRRSPEEATGLEFDTGENAGLRSRLDDRSLPAIADHRRAVEATRAQLARIERSSLSAAARLDYDVAVFVYATLADQLGRYGFVDLNLRPSPYVVSQMNGAYYWLPDFLGSRHPLRSQADLDAYYARLSALATAIDQETDRVRHDAALGVVLPSFTLVTTCSQLQSLRETPAAQTAAIGSAIKRAAAAGLGDISGSGRTDLRHAGRPSTVATDRRATCAAGQGRQRCRRVVAAGRRDLLRICAPFEHDVAAVGCRAARARTRAGQANYIAARSGAARAGIHGRSRRDAD